MELNYVFHYITLECKTLTFVIILFCLYKICCGTFFEMLNFIGYRYFIFMNYSFDLSRCCNGLTNELHFFNWILYNIIYLTTQRDTI